MNIIQKEGHFKTRDGRILFQQSWKLAGKHRASVVMVHGYGEHSSRYKWLATSLAKAGFAVYSYDQMGHGKSEGLRAYIPNYRWMIDHLADFLDQVPEPYSSTFLVGQNMGGGLLMSYALEVDRKLPGLILCGANLKPRRQAGFFDRFLARLRSILLPTFSGRGFAFDLEPAGLSRQSYTVSQYESDPFVFHGKMFNRTNWELFCALDNLENKWHKLEHPLLLLHGEADPIADPTVPAQLQEVVKSTVKTLITYPNALHDLFNDADREKVLGDLVGWINQRLGQPPGKSRTSRMKYKKTGSR